jgi:hypothetical protein
MIHSQTKKYIADGANGNENRFTNKVTKHICHATTLDSLSEDTSI